MPETQAPVPSFSRSRYRCPPYAAKSVVGARPAQEDSWQAVPDLVQLPVSWMAESRQQKRSNLPNSLPEQISTQTQAAMPVPSSLSSPETSIALDPASKPSDSVSALQQATTEDVAGPSQVHFFAVYDGHGGPDVAQLCSSRLHQLFKDVVSNSVPTASGLSQAEQLASGLQTLHMADHSSGTASACGYAGSASSLHTSDIPGSSRPTSCDTPAPSGNVDALREQPPSPEAISLPTIDGIEEALKHAFIQVDAEVANNKGVREVGSTAVVALLGASYLWVANCGDSRAILCREEEAVALSMDHKATRADEVSRVEAAGGYVWWDRVMGELAVSRAIGDHCLRPFVIPEPEITYVTRRPEDHLLLLASDGLWDVFSNEEARKLALAKYRGELLKTNSSKMAVRKAASSLAKAALAKGSRDNVTVIVVDVRLPTTILRMANEAAAAAASHAKAVSA